MQQAITTTAQGTQLQPGQRMSHGMLVAGAGVVGAVDDSIGVLTLPAGGPWTVYALWGQVARSVATLNEANSGYMFVRAATGDLIPNPSPSKFPLGSDGCFIGATADMPVDLLHFYDTVYQAPGKSVLELFHRKEVAVTVAPLVALGIVFGLAIPYFRAIMFMDQVSAGLTLAAEAAIGTMTLAERATRITHIGGTLAATAGVTAAEPIIGYFRLQSDDVKLEPSLWPFNIAAGAGVGATIHMVGGSEPFLVPVDIPVPGGARINAYGTLLSALTDAVEAEIYIGYEME